MCIKNLCIFNVLKISFLLCCQIMKSYKYIIIVFFIITLFNSSCGVDSYTAIIEKEFCDKCAYTGQWKVHKIDVSPCFKTQEECLDWAKKNGYLDKGCVFCK